MIRREHIEFIDTTKNGHYPLMMCNAGDEVFVDTALPTDSELRASGLFVEALPRAKQLSSEAKEELRENLRSAFTGQELPKEIVDAFMGWSNMRGTDWKVIRCVPKFDHVFFVVANPSVAKTDYTEFDEKNFTMSLANQIALGCVWVHLSSNYGSTVVVRSFVPENGTEIRISKISEAGFKFCECEHNRETYVTKSENGGLDEMRVIDYV